MLRWDHTLSTFLLMPNFIHKCFLCHIQFIVGSETTHGYSWMSGETPCQETTMKIVAGPQGVSKESRLLHKCHWVGEHTAARVLKVCLKQIC
jgi:hypothetical protein